jgi:hypothetical protein
VGDDDGRAVFVEAALWVCCSGVTVAADLLVACTVLDVTVSGLWLVADACGFALKR